MTGTPEGGKKAAETRKEHDPEAFKKMGEKGGHESSGRKAMETRAEREGKSVHDVAAGMGRKGGQHSGGGHANEDENDENEE